MKKRRLAGSRPSRKKISHHRGWNGHTACGKRLSAPLFVSKTSKPNCKRCASLSAWRARLRLLKRRGVIVDSGSSGGNRFGFAGHGMVVYGDTS